uniref:Uncharacterized protein n=1 Tax=Branchiostoma floridae TaxID=7739 RepID=C3Z7G8_BRAFL|eukprot:XP_002595752.1 hypothetical protein BRAFLDRAFT_64880 [Branchiostoma floridae]
MAGHDRSGGGELGAVEEQVTPKRTGQRPACPAGREERRGVVGAGQQGAVRLPGTLERQGKCPRVRIEAVHLNDVPAEVWEGKDFPAKNKILRRRLNGNENCTGE